jgi:hypothetical protein
MAEAGPKYTKRHGVYWLLAALGGYFVTQGALGDVSPKNLTMAWIFTVFAGVIGAWLLFVKPNSR